MTKKITFRRWLLLKKHRLMRLRGDPKLIAIGVAIGVSVDFLPTFGLGALFAYAFATLGQVNRIAAVVTSLALKWLIIPFYGANIIVGKLFTHGQGEGFEMPHGAFFSLEAMKHVSGAFFLGSVVNALIFGIAAYYGARYCIVMHRQRKKRKRSPVAVAGSGS